MAGNLFLQLDAPQFPSEGKKRKPMMLIITGFLSVGVKGFEPSTPCSQSRCANRTALRPENLCKVIHIFLDCKF